MIELLTCGLFSFAKDSSKENQDSILPPKKLGDGYIMAVADGVGSYVGAKKASQTAIDFVSNLDSGEQLDDMAAVFQKLKDDISSLSDDNNELYQAATTLTFCHITDDGIKIGHIGDSRMYIGLAGRFRQATTDHTQYQKLLDEKIYTRSELNELVSKHTLTTALSRSIALNYQEIFLSREDVLSNDNEILVCLMSDGAHSFWEERPRFSVNTMNQPDSFAASLRRRIERKSPIDDYSLIVAKFAVA
ncbi:PP2C family protein-serine/threonine phosphatase [Serratia liquefaciens]|uniref:PP2C family protein-serine/threonine phosphatase n=1 Tax=Serratia liquefaciens TaxID=614 RepID=UPI0037FFAA4A